MTPPVEQRGHRTLWRAQRAGISFLRTKRQRQNHRKMSRLAPRAKRGEPRVTPPGRPPRRPESISLSVTSSVRRLHQRVRASDSGRLEAVQLCATSRNSGFRLGAGCTEIEQPMSTQPQTNHSALSCWRGKARRMSRRGPYRFVTSTSSTRVSRRRAPIPRRARVCRRYTWQTKRPKRIVNKVSYP